MTLCETRLQCDAQNDSARPPKKGFLPPTKEGANTPYIFTKISAHVSRVVAAERTLMRGRESSDSGGQIEPLLVKPKTAWKLLGCGNTRGYELLAAGELESFLDGSSRKITTASIRRYIERQLAQGPSLRQPTQTSSASER
jgi:hypothetical protein